MTAQKKADVIVYVIATIFGLGSSLTGGLFAAYQFGDDRYVRREDFAVVKAGMETQKSDLLYIRQAVDELRKIPAKADATSGASMSRTRRGSKSIQARRITPDE